MTKAVESAQLDLEAMGDIPSPARDTQVICCASDAVDKTPQPQSMTERRYLLAKRASGWVQAVRDKLSFRTAKTQRSQVDTTRLDPVAVQGMMTDGVILFEPFGGICAGLDMVLRSGIPVHKYIYADNDPLVQRIARKRMLDLLGEYPTQLRPMAVQDAFTTVPSDIWDIKTADFIQAGA